MQTHAETSSRILIVEDENEIRELIALLLKREGHKVAAVSSVEEAQKLIKSENFDLIALDWMLPGDSGVEFAKDLRKAGQTELPILMVTAKAESEDIVEGLESGADDYLTKPFEPSVLIARVRALLRRNRKPVQTGADLRLGELVMNTETYDVKLAGEPMSLTPSEFKLLQALIQNRGRVLTRDSLISQVQGDGVSVVGRTVDTHVFGLRKKLGPSGDLIETVRGIGYRVRADQ